jgi:hypothetical protein
MFNYVIFCGRCGFHTDIAGMGPPSTMDPERFGFPVYLPSSGTLLTHFFDSRKLGIDPEEFDAWFNAHLEQEIAREYGSEALVIHLGANKDALRELPCPTCHHKELSVKSSIG